MSITWDDGKVTVITLTQMDSHLHTPKYFFLRNFSLVEASFTTVGRFSDCIDQLFFFFLFFRVIEFYLPAAMSSDHYIAICKPLHYRTSMNCRPCTLLVFSSWLLSFLIIFPALMLLLNLVTVLSSCRSNIIDHFICDYFPCCNFPVQTQNS